MTALSTPRNATLKAGSTVSGIGYLLAQDGTNTMDLSALTEVCIGVSADESERDASGLVSGGSVAFYPLGGVLMVASEDATTWALGDTVYVGAGGLATATAGSNKKLGLYVGEGTTTSAAGDLIPVMTAGADIA
jgi:hypothetical protein